jgi:hypothetical protein
MSNTILPSCYTTLGEGKRPAFLAYIHGTFGSGYSSVLLWLYVFAGMFSMPSIDGSRMLAKFGLISPPLFLALQVLHTQLWWEEHWPNPARGSVVSVWVIVRQGEVGDIMEHICRLKKAYVPCLVAKVGQYGSKNKQRERRLTWTWCQIGEWSFPHHQSGHKGKRQWGPHPCHPHGGCLGACR